MPTPPFAELQVSLNGDPPEEGGIIDVNDGDVIQLSAASSIGVKTWRWEIYDYPPAFTVPAGWSNDGAGTFFNTKPTPDPFTIPSQAANAWGKFMLRLRVNGNPLIDNADGSRNVGFVQTLTDESTILNYPSVDGLEGLGFNESIQGDKMRSWAGTIMRFARGLVVAASGFIAGLDLAGTNGAQQVVGFNGEPLDTTGTVARSKHWIWDDIANKYVLRKSTFDDLGPAFAPTYAFAGGGTTPLKLGATTATITFTGSPLPNAGGVTAYLAKDSLGGSVSRLGSGTGFQGPAATYTSSTPTTINFHATVTQNGVTADTPNVGVTFAEEVWIGVGAAGATGINGTTGVLVGAAGTLTATVSASGKVASSPAPASQKFYYVGPAGLSFHDANNDLVPTTSSVISVTNSNSVTTTRTLYESSNLLTLLANPITPS